MSVCVVIKDFRTLKVWQKANSLEHEIGKLVKGFPNHEQYRLVDQIIRRAVAASLQTLQREIHNCLSNGNYFMPMLPLAVVVKRETIC